MNGMVFKDKISVYPGGSVSDGWFFHRLRSFPDLIIFVHSIVRKMLQIDDTLINSSVLDEQFCCDLEKCKGVCCVKGDAGAPLSAEEVDLLPRIFKKVRPFMRSEGIEAVEREGTHVIDEEGETVTPLIGGKECAYVVFNKGIAFCSIEMAFEAGRIDFRKPISCHLYPIRIRRYERFTAVNYDVWDVCKPARIKGNTLKIAVFRFVKEALIRRFGRNWFQHLSMAADKTKAQIKNK